MNNLRDVDALVVSRAQLELSRLSREHHHEEINFRDIQAFREILSMLCNEDQNKEVTAMLERIIEEFCFGQPCREEIERIENLNPEEVSKLRSLNTLKNLKGILSEFDLLLKNSLAHGFALRLYEFCCIFSKHLDPCRSVKGFTLETAAAR